MELLDLYDKNRIPQNKTIMRGDTIPENHYRLVVHIAIFNKNNEMLIQKRSGDDHNWPNLWDLTSAGGVSSGETSAQSATRELQEELGLELNLDNERPQITIHFNKGFDDIFVLEHEVDIAKLTLQKEEVQAVKWVKKDELLHMIDNGEFINYYKSFIELLFELKKFRGIHQKPF